MNNTPLTLERYELEGAFFVASYLQNLRIKNSFVCKVASSHLWCLMAKIRA